MTLTTVPTPFSTIRLWARRLYVSHPLVLVSRLNLLVRLQRNEDFGGSQIVGTAWGDVNLFRLPTSVSS